MSSYKSFICIFFCCSTDVTNFGVDVECKFMHSIYQMSIMKTLSALLTKLWVTSKFVMMHSFLGGGLEKMLCFSKVISLSIKNKTLFSSTYFFKNKFNLIPFSLA